MLPHKGRLQMFLSECVFLDDTFVFKWMKHLAYM